MDLNLRPRMTKGHVIKGNPTKQFVVRDSGENDMANLQRKINRTGIHVLHAIRKHVHDLLAVALEKLIQLGFVGI